MPRILVTGATGTIGCQLVEELVERGVDVIAAGHTAAKLEQVSRLGADTISLDLSDLAQVHAAMIDIDRVFLLTPFVENFVGQVENVITAARQAGGQSLVRLSVAGATADTDLAIARQHAHCEELVKESGLAWTILAPTFFQDNLINLHGDTVRTDSAFYGAAGHSQIAYVSSFDIAASAAVILTEETSRYAGERFVLTGPESLSEYQVAEIASKVAGREIRYIDLSTQELGAGLRSNGVANWMADAVVGLERVKAYDRASELSPAVHDLTGRAGERFLAFLERNREKLG